MKLKSIFAGVVAAWVSLSPMRVWCDVTVVPDSSMVPVSSIMWDNPSETDGSFVTADSFNDKKILPAKRSANPVPEGMRQLYRVSLSASYAGSMGNFLPFWMMNGEYGIAPQADALNTYRVSFFKDIDRDSRFSWGIGADLLTQEYANSQIRSNRQYSIWRFLPQQLYGELKYRSLGLMIGAKEIPGWVSNPELSSGNLTFGNNSRPIPQVRAGIFDYADIWGCNGWVAVKGYLSYGAFTDNSWIKRWVANLAKDKYSLNTLLNSKGFMFRFGDSKRYPLEFEWGIEMPTQFGWTTYEDGKVITKMPRDWKGWLKAFIPVGGGSSTPIMEQLNAEGNTLGNWDFALSWKPGNWDAKLYYQHFFEDHSMLTFDYAWIDGLWGLELNLPKNPVVSTLVAEFIYSKDQAGAVYWDQTPELPEQVSGRDSYYYHYICNGWQNYGMMIGNPLFISPIYNSDHQLVITSNRIIAAHMGLKGRPSKSIGYKVLGSWQNSWGTYDHPFPDVKRQISILGSVEWFVPWDVSESFEFQIGVDRGDLIGNNFGVRFIANGGLEVFAPRKRK